MKEMCCLLQMINQMVDFYGRVHADKVGKIFLNRVGKAMFQRFPKIKRFV